MTIKNQLNKLKENWLIVGIVVVVFLMMFGSNIFGRVGSLSKSASFDMAESVSYAPSAALSYRGGGYVSDGDFAPEVEERKITKTGSMSTEVERGEFYEAESKLKSIVKSSDSYLLNQNVNKGGTNRKSYHTGSYQIKIDTEKYDSVIEQLKDIGEVQSFNENAVDITGTYTKTEIEIESEKAKLKRYEKLYEEAKDVSDKLNLVDRIFNQERTIKYMEDSLKNMDKRVEYSTIYLSINEKKSDYYNVVWVKFSELVKNIVGSFNSLIKLVFVLLPWAIALWIIMFVVKIIRKKKK